MDQAQGAVLRISSDRDDRMGAKIKTPQKFLGLPTKPQKNPMPNFRAIRISRGTTRPEYAGTIMNLQIVLNTHKNPYLNQDPNKYLPNFPIQKIPKSNISNPKIIRSSLSLEIRSTS